MPSPAVNAALARLNRLLPLQARQSALPEALRRLHLAILHGFATHAAPPSLAAIAGMPGIDDAQAALERLVADDLIVISADRTAITGAYPFTCEPRVHTVSLDGHSVQAMCAIDALAIAPMFGVQTQVHSRCHVHATPIAIRMRGAHIVDVTPAHPCVGIRWQATSGCAAKSLCLEMVFLRDRQTAEAWRGGAVDAVSLFDLPVAVQFAAAYFQPLLQDAVEATTPA